MIAIRYRFLVVVWCCMMVSAQITFSRDWSGGKRSPAPPHQPLDCSHLTTLCINFVSELTQSMRKQLHNEKPRRDRITDPNDESATSYDEDN